MTVTEVPELVPARMLNEAAYCPRLFFLEWVDRLWAPSSDTAEGDRQHRRVDAGGGAVPLPSEGEVKAARSVELSSERLGIIAQLDLLEGEDGGVVPVDTKKVSGSWGVGFPRNLVGGAGAGGHGPVLLATGVLPVRQAGAVTGSRVAGGGGGVQLVRQFLG
jgi:hypothetical protein